ncbi:glycoside hydrolase family 19 protein, partial [Streptomyces sp. NPDC005921]
TDTISLKDYLPICSINGSLECDGKNPAQVQSRVSAYQKFTQILGVAAGNNLYC